MTVRLKHLKSSDVGFIKRTAIVATKPDIHVEIDGDNYVITTIATLKTIKAKFELKQEFDLDPGTDRVATVRFAFYFIIAMEAE